MRRLTHHALTKTRLGAPSLSAAASACINKPCHTAAALRLAAAQYPSGPLPIACGEESSSRLRATWGFAAGARFVRLQASPLGTETLCGPAALTDDNLARATAGVFAVLVNGVQTAHAEDGQEPDASGNKSTAQWRVYTDIGSKHYSKGDHAKAELYLKRALVEAKKGFGDEDAHVAAACCNLAELYKNTGKLEEAESLYKQGLRIMEVALGRDDPRFATAASRIAAFYLQRRQIGPARDYMKQCLESLEASLGAAHPAYARELVQLADVERVADDKPAAIALLRRSLELHDALGPPGAKDATVVANKLGQLLMMDGQREAGVAMLRQSLARAEAAIPASDPSHNLAMPLYLASLAEALETCGDFEDARGNLYTAIRLTSARDAHAGTLPPLLVKCAKVEIKLGEATADRDCFLRAHNLAEQASRKFQGLLGGIEKGAKAQKPPFWKPFARQRHLEVKQMSRTFVVLADEWLKARATLAAAQERLGRLEDAVETLSEGLQTAAVYSAAPTEDSQLVLQLGVEDPPPWLEAEVVHLQLVVELLYNFFRLVGDDERARETRPHVAALVQTLQTRLPGVRSAGGPPPSPGLSPLAGFAWNARRRLNELQIEINGRRRQRAATGKSGEGEASES